MDGTQPAALFERGEQTVLAALLAQLGEIVPGATVEVLAPEWAAESIRGQAPTGVVVTACRTTRIALNEVIRHAYEAIAKGNEIALVEGGLVAHGEALAAVLAEPAPAHTALLVGERVHGPGVRTAEGIVVSAGSSAHAVTDPDRESLGVLRVLKSDLHALAEAARGISATGRVSDTATDLLDLLIVGLVRLGARVSAVPVGPYVLYRPQTQLEVGAALVDLKEIDEERLRLVSTARADDGLYATLVGRRLSRLVTRWALRRGIGSYRISAAAMIAVLLAAATFATGARPGLIGGALLLQVGFVLGCADGEIARYTRTGSPFGSWLDAVGARIKEFLVYAGLALGAAQVGTSGWVLAGAMLGVLACRQMVDAGFAVRHAEWQAEEAPEPLTLPLSRRDDAPTLVGAIVSATDDRASANDLAADPQETGGPGSASRANAALEWLNNTDDVPAMVLVRRTLAMPLGERWLVISVGAAVASPWRVLAGVVGITGLAVIYMTIGRMLRSMTHA